MNNQLKCREGGRYDLEDNIFTAQTLYYTKLLVVVNTPRFSFRVKSMKSWLVNGEKERRNKRTGVKSPVIQLLTVPLNEERGYREREKETGRYIMRYEVMYQFIKGLKT